MLFANGKWMFHLVIFQVNHLLCEGSFCAIYLFQPLYREDWDKTGNMSDQCFLRSWNNSIIVIHINLYVQYLRRKHKKKIIICRMWGSKRLDVMLKMSTCMYWKLLFPSSSKLLCLRCKHLYSPSCPTSCTANKVTVATVMHAVSSYSGEYLPVFVSTVNLKDGQFLLIANIVPAFGINKVLWPLVSTVCQ